MYIHYIQLHLHYSIHQFLFQVNYESTDKSLVRRNLYIYAKITYMYRYIYIHECKYIYSNNISWLPNSGKHSFLLLCLPESDFTCPEQSGKCSTLHTGTCILYFHVVVYKAGFDKWQLFENWFMKTRASIMGIARHFDEQHDLTLKVILPTTITKHIFVGQYIRSVLWNVYNTHRPTCDFVHVYCLAIDIICYI